MNTLEIIGLTTLVSLYVLAGLVIATRASRYLKDDNPGIGRVFFFVLAYNIYNWRYLFGIF